MESPRDFVGAVMKTLGLSFNATARDLSTCGIPLDAVMRRAAQLRHQVLLLLVIQLVQSISMKFSLNFLSRVVSQTLAPACTRFLFHFQALFFTSV